MFGKQNHLLPHQLHHQQLDNQPEKETEYQEDRQDNEAFGLSFIDKEIEECNQNSSSMFPTINKGNKLKQQATSQKKKQKIELPELSKPLDASKSKIEEKEIEIQKKTQFDHREHQQLIQDEQVETIAEHKIKQERDLKIKSNEESIQAPQIYNQGHQIENAQSKSQEQPQRMQQQHQQQSEIQIEPAHKIVETALQTITNFVVDSKSSTILFEDTENSSAFQSANYYENHKLALTQPITSQNSRCRFRIENIKYCVGFGVGLKEVIEKHGYDYESEGSNELSHGLYIVTSQGYSWSHSQKEEDDVMRTGFNQMYNGLTVEVNICGEEIFFKWKKGEFKLTLPSRIRQKYTLCYCVYLHEKSDAIAIAN